MQLADGQTVKATVVGWDIKWGAKGHNQLHCLPTLYGPVDMKCLAVYDPNDPTDTDWLTDMCDFVVKVPGNTKIDISDITKVN